MIDALLTDLYCNVLRETQFSITGYRDIEKETNDFFERLSRSAFFKRGNIPFSFLMGGILKVLNTKTWDLETFKSFYCNFFEDANKAEAMSFYFYLTYENGKREGTAKLLSKLFAADIDFRIYVKNVDSPNCQFDDTNRVFEIVIPQSIFTDASKKSIGSGIFKKSFREMFREIFDGGEGYLIADEKDGTTQIRNVIYVNDEILGKNGIKAKYQALFKKVFDPTEIKKIKQVLLDELSYQYNHNRSQFIESEQISELLNELFTSSIALSFLCAYFQSKIEYMMSVGKVIEVSEGKRLFRNIGGLIVGYENNYLLKLEDRVKLNLISDRLTAVVVGDYLNSKLNENIAREIVIENWINKSGKKFRPLYLAQVQDERWKEFESEVSKRASAIWNKFIESKNDNSNYSYLVKADRIEENVEVSDKSELIDFLIVRRLLYACRWKKIDYRKCYELLTYATWDDGVKSSDSKFITDHCIWIKGERKNISLLPEEDEWLKTVS